MWQGGKSMHGTELTALERLLFAGFWGIAATLTAAFWLSVRIAVYNAIG